ncbi:MAG: PfkB family carbohydrate kinase [Armatimonadetes bacterium]|nr:PfkB family carbohydrate kinase [Armatimonadota bacterium]
MNSKNHVLIVGSVAFDTVETPSGKVERALGGAAVYSAVAASFFSPVRMVGVVGDDFPQEHLDFLASRKIDTRGIQVVKGGKTFHWAGSYKGDMNQANTLATELNVFESFSPKLPGDYASSEFVFLANIDPDLQLHVLDQVKSPKLTACDTMNLWISIKRDALVEVLKRVDIVFINDAEARQLTGEINLTRAAARIHEIGPKYVVLKKGEHGAILYCNESTCFAAAPYPLDAVVDPTGAGDSFAGGFMGYIASAGELNDASIRRAVVYGSTMASYNVQDFSLNRFKKLTIKEIDGRYEEFKRIVFFEAIEED